jgi:hypothetical protein
MFKHCHRWLFCLSLGGLFFLGAAWPAPAQPTAPDLRLIFQTEAGITAYTVISAPIALNMVSPLFASLRYDTPEYLLGDYILSGRQTKVTLAIGHAGWVLAYQSQTAPISQLYDCSDNGDMVHNQAQQAVMEVMTALSLTTYTLESFDYRYPQAQTWAQHWLYTTNGTTQQSTLNLPLANSYLERGYAFCTALANSTFYLNNELVDQQSSVTEVIMRYGPLTPNQLRAGQTNALRIGALSLFGSGLMSGVAVVYSGTTDLPATGGGTQLTPLHYPPFLGPPLTIYQLYAPLTRR